MKQKTSKTIKKRYSLSHPKHNKKPVVGYETPGFSHNAGKKRKFRIFRGKQSRYLQNSKQAGKIIQELS